MPVRVPEPYRTAATPSPEPPSEQLRLWASRGLNPAAPGALHISLVNLDPEKAITVHMTAENLISKMVTGRILTSVRFTDINTFREPEKVRPAVFTGAKKQGGELVVTLPPKSVVVVEVK